MSNAKVGVIIPTHKRPKLIARAYASLKAQTHKNWHLVIIGNGMTDDEWGEYEELVIDRKKLRCSRNYPSFANVAQACQFGLAMLDGDTEYVAVLEDDDEWKPEFLTEMASALDYRPECSMAYCDEIELGPDGVEVDWTGHPEIFERSALLNANWIHFPVQMWRYHSLLKLGGFCVEVSGAADWDTALRLSAWGITHVRQKLAIHHWLTEKHDPEPQNNCLKPWLMEDANKWIKIRKDVRVYS